MDGQETGEGAGQAERKWMMYKGGRFARGESRGKRAYTGGHRAKQRDALCERSKRVGGREREKGRERTVHARRIMA